MFEQTLRMCGDARIEPFATNEDALTVELEAFAENNWVALAQEAGEPVDKNAWEAYDRANKGDQQR